MGKNNKLNSLARSNTPCNSKVGQIIIMFMGRERMGRTSNSKVR